MRFLALLLLVPLLAGCADGGTPVDETPLIDIDPGTGGIRGVVVDGAITPVEGATVTLVQTGASVVTDAEGLFTFTDLEPGTYFLEASKPLFDSAQTSTEVLADVADPPILNLQIQRIPGLVAFVETFQFDGFYECAFATGFITDSCDMAVRTVHDEGVDPVPRNVQNNINTAFYPWSDAIQTVVMETWWDEAATATFRSSLQDTPIDNSCDCSTKHMEHKGDGGYLYDRMDRDALLPKNTNGEQTWPQMSDLEDGMVAVRGFIPFQDATSVDYAVNLQFQIFTSFFHNHAPAEGWNLVDRDQYPVPE